MLRCQGCARGLFSRDRGETARDLEARDRGQDQDVQSRGRGETEAFEISTKARPSRGTILRIETASRPRRQPRDRGVKTEATPLLYTEKQTSLPDMYTDCSGCDWSATQTRDRRAAMTVLSSVA